MSCLLLFLRVIGDLSAWRSCYVYLKSSYVTSVLTTAKATVEGVRERGRGKGKEEGGGGY